MGALAGRDFSVLHVHVGHVKDDLAIVRIGHPEQAGGCQRGVGGGESQLVGERDLHRCGIDGRQGLAALVVDVRPAVFRLPGPDRGLAHGDGLHHGAGRDVDDGHGVGRRVGHVGKGGGRIAGKGHLGGAHPDFDRAHVLEGDGVQGDDRPRLGHLGGPDLRPGGRKRRVVVPGGQLPRFEGGTGGRVEEHHEPRNGGRATVPRVRSSGVSATEIHPGDGEREPGPVFAQVQVMRELGVLQRDGPGDFVGLGVDHGDAVSAAIDHEQGVEGDGLDGRGGRAGAGDDGPASCSGCSALRGTARGSCHPLGIGAALSSVSMTHRPTRAGVRVVSTGGVGRGVVRARRDPDEQREEGGRGGGGSGAHDHGKPRGCWFWGKGRGQTTGIRGHGGGRARQEEATCMPDRRARPLPGDPAGGQSAFDNGGTPVASSASRRCALTPCGSSSGSPWGRSWCSRCCLRPEPP